MAMPTSLASGPAPEAASTTAVNGSAVTPAEAATDLFAGLGLNQFTGGGGLPAPQKPAVSSAVGTLPSVSKTQQSKTDVTSPTAALSMQDKHR